MPSSTPRRKVEVHSEQQLRCCSARRWNGQLARAISSSIPDVTLLVLGIVVERIFGDVTVLVNGVAHDRCLHPVQHPCQIGDEHVVILSDFTFLVGTGVSRTHPGCSGK